MSSSFRSVLRQYALVFRLIALDEMTRTNLPEGWLIYSIIVLRQGIVCDALPLSLIDGIWQRDGGEQRPGIGVKRMGE